MNNKYFSNLKSFNEFIKNFNNNDSLHVLSINTRSVSSISRFNKFKNEMSKFSKLPDIVAIQESWINESCIQLYNIPSYESIHCCRSDGFGGASIYVSKHIKFEVLDKDSSDFLDYVVISLPEIKINNKPVRIINLYRSQKCNIQLFLKKTDNLLEKFGSEACMFVGDFNVDMMSDNVQCDYLTNLFAEYNMCAHHNFVTRPVSGTSLDGIFGDIAESFVVHSIENSFTDHNYLYSILQTKTPIKLNINEDFIRINYDKFGKYINENLKLNINITDPSEQCAILINCFKDAITYSTELKTVENDVHYELKPWMTMGLLNLIKFKNKLLKKRRKRKIKEALSNQIKRISKIIKYAKRKLMDYYYQNYISTCAGNLKKIWSFLNRELGRIAAKPRQLYDDNGRELLTDKEKADAHNNFFSEAVKRISENIVVNSDDHINKLRTLSYSETTFNIRKVDTMTVECILKNMPKNKGSGHDEITVKMLTIRESFVSMLLTRIFNSMVETSNFPENLKVHKIIPIPKSSGARSVSLYRPISLLSNISKVFEKLIFNQLSSYLETHSVMFGRQFGFRKGYGTEAAVVSVVSEICNGIDKGYSVAGVFFDLSKAFDLVDHAILLQKLELIGLQESTTKLMESYLNNRSHYVQIGRAKSKSEPVKCGVPQGSTLGPLLFRIYVNDLSNITFFGKLFMFADDICLLYNYKHPTVLKTQIEYDASMLFEYARLNKLSINAEKTNFVRFRPHLLSRELEIAVYIDGNLVNESKTVKYLGVNISYNLSWDMHIEMLKTKISSATGILRKFQFKLSTETKLQLYFALIHCHLVYIPIVYASKDCATLKSLQRAQNKALKVVYNLPRDYPTIDLFTNYAKRVLPVKGIYKHNLLMFMFKSINGFGNSFVQFRQHCDQSQANTRHRLNLIPSRCRLELTKQKAEYAGPLEFNNLPNDIKRIATISNFKLKLKEYLLERLEALL